MSRVLPAISFCSLLFFLSCSRSNNLLEGRVEQTVGTHKVVVTDCYRTRVPPPVPLRDGNQQITGYRFTPCRDADILIQRDQLWVNGRSYGLLHAGDDIVVDHGLVSVDREKIAHERNAKQAMIMKPAAYASTATGLELRARGR